MDNKTIEYVIEKAIAREEEAFAFYTGLYKTVEDPTARDALQFLAEEEKKHKEFLMAYRDGNVGGEKLRMTDIVDYKIAQHIDAPDIDKNMETRDIYLVASHREMNSCN
ncbi:MAG: hypothetical protein E4G96_02605, partial [Chrysiogenales bacterium]